MKIKISFLTSLIALSSLFCLADDGEGCPVLINSTIKQQIPWNGFVDIYCDIDKLEDSSDSAPLLLEAKDAATGIKFDIKSLTLDGIAFENGISSLSNGSYKFEWDARKDIGEDYVTSALVVCASVKVNYMIVDLSAGSTATHYPVTYLNAVPSGGWTDEYKTTKLVLRKIDAGAFMMGSPEDEIGREDIEDFHKVTLTDDYWLGVFETTQHQYELVMGSNPSTKKGSMLPVHDVSYNTLRGSVNGALWPANNNVDASSFMGRLRSKTGNAFDLPTEAQWEYACRAGTTTALNSGKNLTDSESCSNLAEIGCYLGNGSSQSDVGSYLPNAWGLYDMHGNVGEQCLDWFAENLGIEEQINPLGASSGTTRVLRGGGYVFKAAWCRSASRDGGGAPNGSWGHNGFRIGCGIAKISLIDIMTVPKYMIIDLSAGSNATQYPITYLNEIPVGGWTDEYKTTKLVLRKIYAGSFVMGSPDDELGREAIEDYHKVILTEDYWMGVFEMTQRQYELVMGSNPSTKQGSTRPVHNVSYNALRGSVSGALWPANSEVDASSFMGRLRSKTGNIFDLPTEAQWEYACRAGTTTALNSGKNLTGGLVCSYLSEIACYSNHGYYPQNVGSYLPNAWGLYDMHGNVGEQCLDWFAENLGTEEQINPLGATSGTTRVLRGGGWAFKAAYCRSASRDGGGSPSGSWEHNGFRIICRLSKDDLCYLLDTHIQTKSGVPYSWIHKYKDALTDVFVDEEVVTGKQYEDASKKTASNSTYTFEDCYIAGLNPTDETNKLDVLIRFDSENLPFLTWTPDLNERGSKELRKYEIIRLKWDNERKTLIEVSSEVGNSGAHVVPQEGDVGPWFYKVKVTLP